MREIRERLRKKLHALYRMQKKMREDEKKKDAERDMEEVNLRKLKRKMTQIHSPKSLEKAPTSSQLLQGGEELLTEAEKRQLQSDLQFSNYNCYVPLEAPISDKDQLHQAQLEYLSKLGEANKTSAQIRAEEIRKRQLSFKKGFLGQMESFQKQQELE
jgi:hypothetical protein